MTTTTGAPVLVRERTEADVPACVEALVAVRQVDAYPLLAEHISAEWLITGVERAWVALVDETVVGHVAVVLGFGDVLVIEALGRPRAEILGISRLFVAPAGRGRGAAGALLDAVDDHSARSGHPLALDVLEQDRAAIGLYEKRGWQAVGRRRVDWFGPSGPSPWALTYVRRPAV